VSRIAELLLCHAGAPKIIFAATAAVQKASKYCKLTGCRGRLKAAGMTKLNPFFRGTTRPIWFHMNICMQPE
jgi:hypothetical protein